MSQSAIYLVSGLYELSEPIPNPYLVDGFWPAETRFVVKKHVERFGVKNNYKYFSLRLAHGKSYIVKSYQTDKWNTLARKLRPVADEDIEEFIQKISNSTPGVGILLLVLDGLERTGKITRDDIRQIFKSKSV